MRILFMGTPDFAQESLKKLCTKKKYNVIGVVTNVDKPKGRGMKLMASPVKEYALEKKLKKIYQPKKVKNNPEFIEEIKKPRTRYNMRCSLRKNFTTRIIRYTKIRMHKRSWFITPKYRGAAPIQWAVLNGDKETGITTMFMNAGMDTGDMILKEKVQIGEDETTGELWNRLKNIGAKLLIETIKKIEAVSEKRKTKC